MMYFVRKMLCVLIVLLLLLIVSLTWLSSRMHYLLSALVVLLLRLLYWVHPSKDVKFKSLVSPVIDLDASSYGWTETTPDRKQS